jgi:hypothetical protein
MTVLLRSGFACVLAFGLTLPAALSAWAQASAPPAPAIATVPITPKPPGQVPVRGPVVRSAAPAVEVGPRWKDLTPAQRAALTPLEREWAGIDAPSKQKWIEMSRQFSKMAPDERARVQARMADWAVLTPAERGRARLNFEEAKQLPAQDRQARWKAYQALDPEQRRQLAARAASAPEVGRRAALASARAERTGHGGPQAKSNIVPNPAFAAPPRQVTPTVLQAQPGATTTFISKRPTPPAHQQTGMPKIAATPGFVDKTTLLPKRGPQGAAARPQAASAPEPPR